MWFLFAVATQMITSEGTPMPLGVPGEDAAVVCMSPTSDRVYYCTKLLHLGSISVEKAVLTHSQANGVSQVEVCISPTCKFWAATEGNNLTLRDFDSGKILRSLDLSAGRVRCVAFDPSGSRLLAACAKGIAIFSADKQEQVAFIKSNATHALFLDSGNTVLACDEAGRLAICDVKLQKEVRTNHFHPKDGDGIASVSASRNGKLAFLAMVDGRILRVDTGDLSITEVYKGKSSLRSILAFRESNRLAVGTDDGELLILDLDKGAQVSERKQFKSVPTSLSLSKDEKRFAIGLANGSCSLLSLPETRELWRLLIKK